MSTEKNNRLFALVLILLIITNLFAIGISVAEELEPDAEGEETGYYLFDTVTTTLQIDPGEMFYVYFDQDDLELVAKPPIDLPDECDLALAIVPEWLRTNLSYKFRQLSSDYRTTYADLILSSPDEKYIDEIAFCIAHSAVENLEDDYFFPQLLTHNAQLIYDNDEYLNYVDVVERGDYTTVIYKDKDNVSVELPKDLYYWYIVHPKLSDELPTYVDPDYNYFYDAPHDKNYGVPPPTGKFWRDWLFYYNDTGYPLLKEYLEGCYTLWEAISACNSWISGSMSFTSDEERPIQPVRIYRKHIGRCGEYQDMRNAIARAGLIPSTCTCNVAEDHVWNEFWDKRWIHWDGTIDNPMMYEKNWGKDISSVWNTRGDSNIWSVTNKYTPICNFTATVLDSSGLPVDGALVDVATENYYNPDLLSTTTWGTTDYTGNVTIPLGDVRNYWSSAESDELGSDPINGVTQVITNASVGANYTYTFNLPLDAPALNALEATPPSSIEDRFRMEVSYEVVANILKAENSFTGEHGELYGPSGNIDFFIADSLNYNQYLSGLVFFAFNVTERSTSGDVSFILPSEDRFYAVLSNEFSQATTKIVNLTINIISVLNVEITSPENGSECNLDDTIHITGTALSPGGVNNVEIDIDNLGDWSPAVDTSGPDEEAYSTWEFYLDTMGLTPGMHTIQAKASHGENSSLASINISLRDVTSPEIMIESPAQDSKYWLGEILTINGTATDNVAVQILKLIIDSDEINGTDITSFLKDGFWSYEINTNDLGYGDHSITLWANDTSSNSISFTRNIKILEAVEPEVRIESPSDGLIFKLGEDVEISGVATDNMGVFSLGITIDNKAPIDITSRLKEDGSWSYDWNTGYSSSSDGLHAIMVEAVDESGNIASDKVDIILDGKPPEATISLPEDDQIFKAGDSIDIHGTAFDDCGLDKVQLLLGNKPPVDITRKAASGNWHYNWNTLGLESGAHTISVSATDSVGHNTVAGVTVIIDAEEPVVEVLRIEETKVIGDLIVLSGSAYDDIGLKEITLVIDYNEPIDITSTLSNGNWEYQLDTTDMSEGKHLISVIVTDNVDDQASDNIRIKLVQESTPLDSSPDDFLDDEEDDQKDIGSAQAGLVFMFILIVIVLVVLVVVALFLFGRKER